MRQAILAALLCASFAVPQQQQESPPNLYGHLITSEGVMEQWTAQDPAALAARVVSRVTPVTDPDITIEWKSGQKTITLNFWKKLGETEEQFAERVRKRVSLMQGIYPE